MEKRKWLTCLFCLILCYSLFQHTARAPSSSQASIFSQGSITYSSSNVNLAVIPDTWGQYDLFGRVVYGADPQIIFLDNAVVHTAGKPSMRLEIHTAADVNTAREIDCTWYPAKGGDHIIAKCWMKIDSNPNALGRGARIGIDFYGASGYITGVSGAHGILPQPDADVQANFVPWGTVGWAQRTIDFILPTTAISESDGSSQIITSIVLWAQVERPTDAGSGWFADAELYINPT